MRVTENYVRGEPMPTSISGTITHHFFFFLTEFFALVTITLKTKEKKTEHRRLLITKITARVRGFDRGRLNFKLYHLVVNKSSFIEECMRARQILNEERDRSPW